MFIYIFLIICICFFIIKRKMEKEKKYKELCSLKSKMELSILSLKENPDGFKVIANEFGQKREDFNKTYNEDFNFLNYKRTH